MHTHHPLRPPKDAVEAFLAEPNDAAFEVFARRYRAELDKRFRKDRAAFDALAELARDEDVFLGCSCPTKKNPDVRHCHTWLALEFFRDHYPDLDVRLPASQGHGR